MDTIKPSTRHGNPVPAEVFACLVPGEIRLLVLPRLGIAGGGAPQDIPISTVPFELRTPNTPLWVELDAHLQVVRAWKREKLEEDGKY